MLCLRIVSLQVFFTSHMLSKCVCLIRWWWIPGQSPVIVLLLQNKVLNKSASWVNRRQVEHVTAWGILVEYSCWASSLGILVEHSRPESSRRMVLISNLMTVYYARSIRSVQGVEVSEEDSQRVPEFRKWCVLMPNCEFEFSSLLNQKFWFRRTVPGIVFTDTSERQSPRKRIASCWSPLWIILNHHPLMISI